jgi:hypothetical protein
MTRDICARLFAGYSCPRHSNFINITDDEWEDWQCEFEQNGKSQRGRFIDLHIVNTTVADFLRQAEHWDFDVTEDYFFIYHAQQQLKDGGLGNGHGLVTIEKAPISGDLVPGYPYGLHWEINYSY